MRKSLIVIRWIVGLLFIFSGLIKANDPLGLSYKMQEFFEVWGLQNLNNYTLAFALVMNVFEVLAGVAVIIGWRMRLFSWLLLLLIIFFTFLTGYAYISGNIKTCGCFGDCIPLTPLGSFIKDIALLVLIIILFINRKNIRPAVMSPFPQVLLLLV
ncbi:MAG TPA: MauE/DoxX family redox-associated membrane protein, partial [Chitinophagaceae bacterium]|nr:MauE/DoxX family redox-associated membrane protein [Chitinophagaceae bacterium]